MMSPPPAVPARPATASLFARLLTASPGPPPCSSIRPASARPSLAVLGDSLYVAFISNDSSNRVLVCSTSDGTSWGRATDTKQTSPRAPSLAAVNGSLFLAFVSNDSRNAILLSSFVPKGTWGAAIDTKQSCKFSPSLATFSDNLYVAFTGNNDAQTVLVSSSQDWSVSISVNQSSSAGPSLATFSNNLNVGFIANGSSGECLLTSSAQPSDASLWPATNTDLEQSSNSGVALAIAPFACCSKMVQPSSSFGGGHNYFMWSGSCSPPAFPTGLKLTIEISSDLLSSTGLSFQWNGWPPAGANVNCKWQQYGFTIDTNGNIHGFVENWKSKAYAAKTGKGNIVNHRPFVTKLPSPTLPAGYSLTIELANDRDRNITGVTWKVFNQAKLVGSVQQTLEQSPTNVPAAALSPIVGYELALVGLDIETNKGVALFESGAGTFTVSSANPLVPATQHPPCLEGPEIVTGESGSSIYAQLPACPSKTMVQPFTVKASS